MLQDLKFGARLLRLNPGFTLTVIVTLAFGIAANTAIFSIVNAVLLRPLPYKDPARLVAFREIKLPEITDAPISMANFIDYQQQNASFDHLEAILVSDVNLTGTDNPEWVRGMTVTTGFFSMLGMQPLLGRDFRPDDSSESQNNVVIISHQLWKRQFGGDSDIINRTIRLEERSCTVIGVMPPNAAGLRFRDPDVWMPMTFTLELIQKRDVRNLLPFARLKPDVTIEQARQEMKAIAGGLAQQYPESSRGWDVALTPLLDYAVGPVRTALLLMLGVVAFVLLITCTNVANLLLARSATRQREIAVRSALGASRGRLIRQLLTESLMLSVAGGLAGSTLAFWSMDLMMSVVPGWLRPRILDVAIDGRMLGFTIGVTALSGLVFGLVPALQSSKSNLSETLKSGARGLSEGVPQRSVRSGLVVAEIAMSLVLLIGAGLLIRSFVLLQSVDPGFNPQDVLTVSLSLPEKRYPTTSQQQSFYSELLERVSSLHRVRAAATASSVPFSNARFGFLLAKFEIEGRPVERGKEPQALYAVVSSEYFKAMSIGVLRGRDFTDRDTAAAPGVAIISETMARQSFSGEDPIGKRIRIDRGTTGVKTVREIVGVVADVKIRAYQDNDSPQVYEPFIQKPLPFMTIIVRSEGEQPGLSDAVRAEVLKLDKDQPIFSIIPLERLLSGSIEQSRSTMILFGAFALVALLLAAFGLYGVTSYTVSQRTHEIGIRMTLGAQQKDVLGLILRRMLKLSLSGVAIGLIGAWWTARLLESLLYRVSISDPLTFAAVSLLLILVAFVACIVPARRAVKIDPMIALRHE